nr:MAG TPA: hypothetical protein [Caudoviricetes sp.]
MCPTSHMCFKPHNQQPATYQATTTNQHELQPTNTTNGPDFLPRVIHPQIDYYNRKCIVYIHSSV